MSKHRYKLTERGDVSHLTCITRHFDEYRDSMMVNMQYTSLHNDNVLPLFFKGNKDSASNLMIFTVSHFWYFIGCSIEMKRIHVV